MSFARTASALIATLLTGCAASPAPSTLPTLEPSQGVSAVASPSPSQGISARASPSPSPRAVLPGRPYDADALLDAMRQSRRPGGVPDELETSAVAEALAMAIWTIDGRPWDTLSVGGSCGPERCTLEIGGAHGGAAGEDLWVVSVVPSTGSVEVVSAVLRSLPPSRVAELDALARTLSSAPDDHGLIVTAARWLPSPAEAVFVMSYRSGDESGCELELTIDATTSSIVDEHRIGC